MQELLKPGMNVSLFSSVVLVRSLLFSYGLVTVCRVRLHIIVIVLVSELITFQLTKRLLVLVNSSKSVLFEPIQFSSNGIEYMIP